MATIPTATEIRDHLEGYNITTSIISDAFIVDERDNNIIPFIESVCRTSLSAEKEVTEWYSGNGTSILILNRRNINSVSTIQLVSGEDVTAVINPASIDKILAEGILKVKSGLSEYFNWRIFPKGEDNLKITYKYGGTITGDIAMAVKKLVCSTILDNLEGSTGGGDLSTQGFSRNYGEMGKYTNIRKRLNSQAMAILNRYKTAVVGA